MPGKLFRVAVSRNLTCTSSGVVAFLGAHKQPRQTARRRDSYPHPMPLAVVGKCLGFVTDRILVPQLEGNLFENIVHFGRGTWETRLAAGNTGELVDNSLTFHTQRTAGIVAAENADSVQRDVGFFE